MEGPTAILQQVYDSSASRAVADERDFPRVREPRHRVTSDVEYKLDDDLLDVVVPEVSHDVSRPVVLGISVTLHSVRRLCGRQL